ncbi:MAG: zinc-dependent peptidase [Bacteroidetes bacterium]|nr:zinc-dependent peptidase [Bacteroidota bacterium]
MAILVFILFIGGIIYLLRISRGGSKMVNPLTPVEEKSIQQILEEEVPFFKQLRSGEHRQLYIDRVADFIESVRFTSAGNAKHVFADEVLVAASAMIPLYAFPEWTYPNIREIIFYEGHFDEQFESGKNKSIMGMVGDGYLNDTMLLSLDAVRTGFDRKEGSNTALHEFIHLIDKADGSVDGIPEYFIPKHLIQPWMNMIRQMIIEIRTRESDINPYGGSSDIECFAVVSEYFFEKPELLRQDHPEVYTLMNRIFKHYSGKDLNVKI